MAVVIGEQMTPKRLVAEWPGLFNENTLRWWRVQGYGPKFFKVGKRVFYRRTDVQAWLDAQYAQAS
ncbi:MAG: hypothetical protein J0I14_10830 [Propionibacteriaceae bacterium]|jgi:hypothetical protein|nr:hypothetical protein [Propionibacteriaceae bacterium]